MTENFDYLLSKTDAQVLKNLAQMGAKLEELQVKVLEKEAELKLARGELDHYKSSVLPMAMFDAGVNSIELADGNILRTTITYKCSPNKNEEDRKKIYEWLKKYGGEGLIEKTAMVGAEGVEKLKSNNIPYIEQTELNTNSLKSFIKSP